MTQYNYKILNVVGDASPDPFSESSTQLYPLGTKLEYGDRTFRYAKMGSGAVTAGKLLQTKVAVGDHRDLAVPSGVSIGSSTITVTVGGTKADANEYSEGYLHINDVDGQGQLFRIKSHPEGTSTNVVFTLYDKVNKALTGNSKADLIHSSYYELVIAPNNETGAISGVTVIDMTAENYGWVQTSGPCSVLIEGTIVLGENACRSTGSTVGTVAASSGDANCVVGQVLVVNGSTDNGVIHLNIE
jgi:hypothetical protein